MRQKSHSNRAQAEASDILKNSHTWVMQMKAIAKTQGFQKW